MTYQRSDLQPVFLFVLKSSYSRSSGRLLRWPSNGTWASHWPCWRVCLHSLWHSTSWNSSLMRLPCLWACSTPPHASVFLQAGLSCCHHSCCTHLSPGGILSHPLLQLSTHPGPTAQQAGHNHSLVHWELCLSPGPKLSPLSLFLDTGTLPFQPAG